MFNILSKAMFRLSEEDMLCGIKGFRRETALELFRALKSDGWIFDVELLYLAKKRGKVVKSVPIHWEYTKGSRMRLTSPLMILLELVKLRLNYA
jgi:dolichyl-phosphate beta-glucosyltransferase